MFYILLALALVLMIIGLAFRKPQVAIAAALAWVLFGIYSYTNSSALWDIYYDLFVLSFIMTLICLIDMVILFYTGRKEKPIIDEDEEEYQEALKEVERREKDRERRRMLYSGQSPPKLPLPRPSSYSQTGIHEEKR